LLLISAVLSSRIDACSSPLGTQRKMSGYPQLGGDTAGNGVSSNVEYHNMDNAPLMNAYRRKQCGCLGVLLLIGGIMVLCDFSIYIALSVADQPGAEHLRYTQLMVGNGVTAILIALATMWITVEDRGQFLLVQWGPCRCFLCGQGKEKILYKNIRSYQLSKTCWFGMGLFGAIKLFNTCSCCCGDMGSLFGQHTIALTINERAQALGADDVENWWCENCCIRTCCGESGYWCGRGCCFQPCCNPCDANCCVVNTVYISTNDPNGLMQLLDQKTGSNSRLMEGAGGMATI